MYEKLLLCGQLCRVLNAITWFVTFILYNGLLSSHVSGIVMQKQTDWVCALLCIMRTSVKPNANDVSLLEPTTNMDIDSSN
jgi:hypothetical protein